MGKKNKQIKNKEKNYCLYAKVLTKYLSNLPDNLNAWLDYQILGPTCTA